MTDVAESWQNSNIDFKIGIDSVVSRKVAYPLDCGVLILCCSPSSALIWRRKMCLYGRGSCICWKWWQKSIGKDASAWSLLLTGGHNSSEVNCKKYIQSIKRKIIYYMPKLIFMNK